MCDDKKCGCGGETEKENKCREGKTDKPEECTEEQIKKCHGDDKGHPCCE